MQEPPGYEEGQGSVKRRRESLYRLYRLKLNRPGGSRTATLSCTEFLVCGKIMPITAPKQLSLE
jgi:hypothetical protein